MLSHNPFHATLPATDLARAKAFYAFKDGEGNLLGIIRLG